MKKRSWTRVNTERDSFIKTKNMDLTLYGPDNRRRIARRAADFLEYLLMLVVLAECNSMYCFALQTVSRVDMSSLFYRLAILLAAASLALRLWLNPKKLRLAVPNALGLAALVAYAALFFVLNVRGEVEWRQRIYLKNFLLFLPMMTALFKVKQREGKGLDLILKYADIVCVLAAASLTVYLASVFRPDSVPADLIYCRWYNRNVTMPQLNLLDVSQSAIGIRWQMFGIALLRNCGFYTEPLMFALPLLITLFTELFLRDRRSRWRALRWVLLSVTLVTVNSTIGVMLTAAAWGLKIISALLERRKRWLVIPILVLAIAAVGVLYLEKGRTTYESTEESGTSLGDHLDDYSASFKAFASEPLLGVGFDNEDEIFPYMQAYRLTNPGLSNTLGVMLAEGGLVFGALCLMPFVIWSLYLFRKRDWRVACWGLGALGVAAGIIFKYHLVLMMLIAFGYSLPDAQRDGRRVKLTLTNTARQRQDEALEAAGSRKRLFTWACYAMAAALFAAAVLFGAPLWNALHTLMRSHQFSMGQSPLRSFCFAAALLVNGIAIRQAARGELSWVRIALLAAWNAAYLLLYPALFSRVNTLLPLLGVWGELRECALLLAAWLAPAALVLFIQPKAWMNRRGAILTGAVAMAIIAAILGTDLYVDHRADSADALLDELETIAESATGPVYVNDLPLLYHRQVKGVDLTTTWDSGYEVLENASIVFEEETGSRELELIEAGFQVTELEDGHVLYTDDEAVIDALSARGTRFYRYYAFGHKADLEWLAELNGLTLTEDGAAVVEGPVESLASGPYDTVFPGDYTVTYTLHVDPAACAEMSADSWVCRAKVTRQLGDILVVEQPVTPEAFDESGDAEVRVAFSTGDILDDVEYQLLGECDLRIEVRSIDIRQTPTRITVTEYNNHRDPVRESYYNPDGTPYLQDGTYAILEQDFNATNQVVAQRFFDAEGNPVLVGPGYAEARYTYNEKSFRDTESFYGPDGQPILVAGGYTSCRLEYDAYGNLAAIHYYDIEGNPVEPTEG